MTTFTLPQSNGRIFELPTRVEVRTMLTRPSVMIAAIVAVTMCFLATLAVLAMMAYFGRSTEVLTTVLVVPTVTALVAVLVRQKAANERMDRIIAQGSTPATDRPTDT